MSSSNKIQYTGRISEREGKITRHIYCEYKYSISFAWGVLNRCLGREVRPGRSNPDHVAKQLQHYLNCNNLFPVFQSAYRQNHSTETALLKVMNDILLNMNNQHVILLILLDLNAAFDTVNHDTMLRRLEYSFGIQGKALSWFASYLSGRTQRIMINESLSKPFKLECGVPQASCLGPLLFTLYTNELFEMIKYHLPMIHCYADDSQVYISFSQNDRAEQLAVVRNMADCIRDIRFWMLNNDLKFNDDKTEFLIIGTSQQLEKLDNISTRVGDSDIHPVPLARNLVLGCP